MRDDVQLIEQTLSGDSSAFGELVTRYQDRLLNAVVHVIGSHDEALDVVQDAFVQAYTKLDSFKGESAFYTWLYRIAFNTAVTHRRKRRSEMSIERVREEAGGEPIDRGGAPDEPLEQQERVAQVRAALARLSEEHRTVLVLREIDGCCYETIAEILDMPVGTVRSRLHRARLQLRDELKEVFQEDHH